MYFHIQVNWRANIMFCCHNIINKANFQSVCVDEGFKVEVSLQTHFARP